jgi:hypothetical protein
MGNSAVGRRVTLEPLPESHLRVLRDGLPVFDRFALLLAGGYALRAHRLLCRPSQDLDLATADSTPLEQIAEEVSATYRTRGYDVSVIEARPRSARLLLSLPADGGQVELDLLKEALGPSRITVKLSEGTRLAALPLEDAVGLKVRALHDRFVVRDIIDLQAAAVQGGFSFIDLENLGRRHEPDLDLESIAFHLAGVPMFEDEDFALYDLDADRTSVIRTFAADWHQELSQRLGEQEGLDAEY